MKLAQLLENIEILECTADPTLEISGISYDSRKTKPGDLFVAIKGFEADGHRFIPKAVANGATAVLCEDAPADGTPYIKIRDCRYGLAIVSRDFYGNPAERMKLVGFTGTSGKTSSTYILKHVLEARLGAKVGLIGTNGNMIGDRLLHTEHTTPESLELHQLFKQMADEAIDDICSRGRLPVMCGGTGFYIQSVIYGIDFTENESRPDIRARLQAYADEHGADALHDLLREREIGRASCRGRV